MEIYHKILEKEYSARLKKNPHYSLRAFARSMAINHGALSQILSGSRIPSYKLMTKMLESLNLKKNESINFQRSIANSHVAKKPKRINPKLKKIATHSFLSSDSAYSIEADKFAVISDWYHYAIFCMIQKDNFEWKESTIAKQLGITLIQVRMSVFLLKKLNLIEEVDGKLKCLIFQIDTSNKEKTTLAHKKRIKQVLEKSVQSLNNQDLALRDHSTMTMAIDPQKIPEAKKRIQQFISDLCFFLESGKKLEVYEFATSLFSLEKPGENF